MTPEERRRNAELEDRVRVAGEDYERYLLADAYHHAAMRRMRRTLAARQATKPKPPSNGEGKA